MAGADVQFLCTVADSGEKLTSLQDVLEGNVLPAKGRSGKCSIRRALLYQEEPVM